ncbi:hypothetical protein P691DRAFT_780133 [Macrolepiota fuliginosa MF-IS2]|uniref:Uncharacterized protein n=1 Tax=Macrolepiota fuliginosa MF-IS2 TaxID=1400762 RepID=A0A9P6BUK7_9AGAR|nr:hypothetical protein P691DRAFT_780133 [Macrolepiota fuliginosa MF-IS2]
MDRIVHLNDYKATLGALRDHQIVTYATLPSLGVDKARLINSTIRCECGCVLVELDKPVDGQGNIACVNTLLQFMDLTPFIETAIWGDKSSERCAVVEPERHGISDSSDSTFLIVGF